MLEKHVWRDFAAVTFSVAVLGLGLGSTVYLYVLGGIAGAMYTLSLVASGEYFSGAALLRASGLIALTWNVAGTVGPIATGVAMRLVGNAGVAAVLWLIAAGFCVVFLRSEGRAGHLRAE
jgi:hypothetical protein